MPKTTTTSPLTFEKALRVVHFVSFFLAGLSRKGQNVLWITDEDDIAVNLQKLYTLGDIWKTVLGHCLQHDLGHVKWGTTKVDDGSRQVEDLAAIPDVVAGALAECLTDLSLNNKISSSALIAPSSKQLSQKTGNILLWAQDNSKSLKRLNFMISNSSNGKGLSFKLLKFHDLSAPSNTL